MVGLFPVTGIPLPFISAGGSSLIISFAAIGVLLSVSRETVEKEAGTMRLLIAGGGTGGHIYPALAVARSLLARPDGAELRWLGGHRGLEATLVPAAGIPFQRLALRSLRTVQRDAHLILDPLRLGAAVPQAAAILARWRPAAILTTGGYVAVPVLLAAGALRIPSVLWEGNVIPGKSARFVARLASAVAVSHPATIAGLGIPRGRAFVTGTPIRRRGHGRS